MANGKSPSPTGVTSDAFCAMVWCEADPAQAGLNADADYLCQYITDILKLFWEGELDVEAWKTGSLSPVPKPGDLFDPNKWRPVCLLKTSYKVLASILACQINPLVRDHRLEAQCRSLNLKGCPNAPFSLKSALQIRREHSLSTHVLFVDLVKAFDTVNRDFLFKIL
eukprot:9667405-Ditylum_brightwellii.AAC.1